MQLEYYPILDSIKKTGQHLVFDDVAKMNVFVIEDINTNFFGKKNYKDDPLDLPFENVFFEVLSTYDGPKHSDGATNFAHEFLKSKSFFGVVERGFNKYTFYVISKRDEYKYKVDWINDDSENHPIIKDYIRDLLVKMKTQSNATVNERRRKSIRVGRKKKHYELKPVVYCAPKKYTKKFEKIYSRKLKWSHSWEVGGHWRKIKGIGKDRYGEYKIKGLTWVKAHTRGEGNLVKKTRVIQ